MNANSQPGSLTLVLEPRMMFDAAAAATAAEVAAQAEANQPDAAPQADDSPVSAAGTDATVQIDVNGESSSVDVFDDVTVGDPDGKTYDTIVVTVEGASTSSSLMIGGETLKLEHGASVTFNEDLTLSAKVSVSGDGVATVEIDVFGLDQSGIQDLIDGIQFQVDGETQGSGDVTVTLESIKYADGAGEAQIDAASTISVESQYNFKPSIEGSPETEIADQIFTDGDVSYMASAGDGSATFVMTDDGAITVYVRENGALEKVASIAAESIEGLSGPTGMAASADGSALFLIDGSRVYSLRFDGSTLTFCGSAETGGTPWGETSKLAVSEDGKTVFATNGKPQIRVFSVADDGSIEIIQNIDGDFDFLASCGDYVIAANYFWLSPVVKLYERTEDGKLTEVASLANSSIGDWDPPRGLIGTTLEDGAVFYYVDYYGAVKTFAYQNGTFAEGQSSSVNAIDLAVSEDGKTLYALTGDGVLITYAIDAKGAIAEASRVDGLEGATSVEVGADGGVMISGDAVYFLTNEKTCTIGGQIAFGGGLTLSDPELDAKDDFGGASLTVTANDADGTFTFADGVYSFKENAIFRDDVKLAAVSESNGTLQVTFESGCTKADANAILQGWRYEASASSKSISLSMTFSDGSKTSEEHVFEAELQPNRAPSVEAAADVEQTFDTAGDEVAIFDDLRINAGEMGQTILEAVVTVEGIDDADASEYLLLDGVKISLTESSSGSTKSGFGYEYTVGENGTATLTITFTGGAVVETVRTTLTGMAYGNGAVAGETTTGLTGDRTFEITRIRDSGGTEGGGEDAAEPGIESTIHLALNSAPDVSIGGDISSEIFDYAGILAGSDASFVNDIQISPDGKTVVACCSQGGSNGLSGDSVIMIYSRDPQTGDMKLLQTLSTSEELPWLNRASNAVFSPDGSHVYVAGCSGEQSVYAISSFRISEDGTLTYEGAAVQGDNGITGLDGWISEMQISADGKYLYAVDGTAANGSSTGKSALSIFEIDAAGTLKPVGTVTDNIANPSDIAFSSDGSLLFISNAGRVDSADNTISVFERNPATGELSFLTAIDTGGTKGCTEIAVSPDGTVYAMTTDAKILVFTGSDGEYALKQTLQVEGILTSIQENALEISADGKTLYAGGYQCRGVKIYAVQDDGTIVYAGEANSNGSNLIHSNQIAVSADGTTILWGGLYVGHGVSSGTAASESADAGRGAHIGALINVTDADAEAAGDYQGFEITFTPDDPAAGAIAVEPGSGVTVSGSDVLWNGTKVAELSAPDDAGASTLTFTASTTPEAFRAVLNNVLFQTAADVQTTVRVQIEVADGDGKSTSALIAVKPENLSVLNPNEGESTTAGADGATLFPEVEIEARDPLLSAGLQLVISTSSDPEAQYSLDAASGYAFGEKGAIRDASGRTIGSWTNVDGTLTMTFAGDTADTVITQVLQSVVYVPSDALADAGVAFDLSVMNAEGDVLSFTENAVKVTADRAPDWIGSNETYEIYPGSDVHWSLNDWFRDPDGDKLTFEVLNLPDGLTYDEATQTISGRLDTQATTKITVKASDGKHQIEHVVEVIVSTDASAAPRPVEDAAVTNPEAGSPYSEDWSGLFMDPNGDDMTFEASGLPEGLVMAEDGTVEGTPVVSGEFNVTVTATDETGAYSSVQIRITVENVPPTWAADADQTALTLEKAGDSIEVDLSTLFADPDNTTLSFSAEGLPNGLALENGILSGEIRQSGPYSFTITATDAYGAATTWTFEGNIVDDTPPQFNENYADFEIEAGAEGIPTEDVAIPGDLFEDACGIDAWTITGVAQNGTTLEGGLEEIGLAFEGDTLAITGTPLKAGVYTITIEVRDPSGNASSHDLTLVVAENEPPAMAGESASASVVFGNAGTVDLNDYFADPENQTLSFEVKGELPPGMTFDPDTGRITGAAEAAGDYALTLLVKDGVNTTEADFTLTVRENHMPVASQGADAAQIVTGVSSSVDLGAYFTDPDGDAVTISITGVTDVATGDTSTRLPAGLTFDAETNQLYGTVETAGQYVLNVTVTDQYGAASHFELPLVIRDNAAPAENGLGYAEGNVGGTLSVDTHAYFKDLDGDSFTVQLESSEPLPEGFELTFDQETGRLFCTSDVPGAVRVTLTAVDAYGAAHTRTIIVAMRIAAVPHADPLVWNEPFGKGLELLRDRDLVRELDRPIHRPTELLSDAPAFRPAFGVPHPDFYSVGPADGALESSDALFAAYKAAVDADEDARPAVERADAARERRVESHFGDVSPDAVDRELQSLMLPARPAEDAGDGAGASEAAQTPQTSEGASTESSELDPSLLLEESDALLSEPLEGGKPSLTASLSRHALFGAGLNGSDDLAAQKAAHK